MTTLYTMLSPKNDTTEEYVVVDDAGVGHTIPAGGSIDVSEQVADNLLSHGWRLCGKIRDFHPKVRAIQIGNLDETCAAVNESRAAGDSHLWHNRHRIFVSRKDGSFTSGAVGDWIVIRVFDGAMFVLGDEAFATDYRRLAA